MCKKYKYLLFILVLLYLSYLRLSYSTPVDITSVTDSPDPIAYNDGNITMSVVITRVDAEEDNVILQILSPYKENISYVDKIFIDSQRNEYIFKYNPNTTAIYSYRIYAINTYNESTISQTYTFESAKFPYLDSISYNHSVKWDNGSVEFYVWMRKWVDYFINESSNNVTEIEYNISNVTVIIESPEVKNISLVKIKDKGNLSLWYGTFDPYIMSRYIKGNFDPIYVFRVMAQDIYGNTTISKKYSFVAEGYYPQIEKIYVYHKGILTAGSNVTIYAVISDATNATCNTSDVNLTQLYLLKPDLSLFVFNMSKINETYYALNITLSKEGDYYFKIVVEDSQGNIVESGYHGLSTSPSTCDLVNISVRVAPSCMAKVFLLPHEDKLLVNTTVIWLSIFENLGNVPLNETTNISIEKDVINPGEEKFVVLPPNIISYARGDTEEVQPLDDTFFFLIWYTYGLPLGNYTARTYSHYESNVSFDNMTYHCNGTVNDTVHFQLVDAIGETRASPILVIREMPGQIYQDPHCLTDKDSCISTKVRLILFNRGDKVAYNITLRDVARVYNCSYSNNSLCNDVSIRCINSSVYTCAITTNKSAGEMASITFNLTHPLSPRDYAILEYEITPPESMLVYNYSVYKFEASGSHLYGNDNAKYIIKENDLHYNKEEYKLMFLSPLPSFMYDLTVLSSNTTEKRRTFSSNKDEDFLIKADYISSLSTSNWTINITFPRLFFLKSCDYVSGPMCSCRVDNISNRVICSSSSSIKEGDSVQFKVVANTKVNSDYLLPVYFNDSYYSAEESFLPGLFVISIPKVEIKIPKPVPQPEPQPVPQPQPQPQPQTGPEMNQQHLPKIEIVLRPLNDSYVVYQGDTFPTYFEVKNIGNATAKNISLDAILPSNLWRQSKAYIDVLHPGEKVNRTLMFSLDDNVAPGIYIIPVKAMVKDSVGDIAYIKIKVLFAKKLAKLKILEMPQEIEIMEGSNLTIPVLVRNIGRKTLHNVSMRIENTEGCLDSLYSTKEILNLNESKTIFVRIKAKEVKSKQCKAIAIAYSDEGAYDFMPIIIRVYPKPALLPLSRNLTPLISLLWTLIFIMYAVIRKRKAMRGERPKSKIPRLILYLLLLGELIIIIYVVLWIVGVVNLL